MKERVERGKGKRWREDWDGGRDGMEKRVGRVQGAILSIYLPTYLSTQPVVNIIKIFSTFIYLFIYPFSHIDRRIDKFACIYR